MNGQRILLVTLLATWASVGCAHKKPAMTQHARSVNLVLPNGGSSSHRTAQAPKILPETHFAAGRLFEAQGDFAKAISQYRKATVVQHAYFEAFERLGVLLSISGQREAAMTALTRAVELKPNDAIARNNLGFEFMLQRKLADAEAQFRGAIELKHDFARAYINLALVNGKQQRFDEALANFRIVLPDVDAFYNIGLLYRAQRQFENAAVAFRQAIAINPEFTAAHRQLEKLRPHLSSIRPSPDQVARQDTPEGLTKPFPTRSTPKDRDVKSASAKTPTQVASLPPPTTRWANAGCLNTQMRKKHGHSIDRSEAVPATDKRTHSDRADEPTLSETNETSWEEALALLDQALQTSARSSLSPASFPEKKPVAKKHSPAKGSTYKSSSTRTANPTKLSDRRQGVDIDDVLEAIEGEFRKLFDGQPDPWSAKSASRTSNRNTFDQSVMGPPAPERVTDSRWTYNRNERTNMPREPKARDKLTVTRSPWATAPRNDKLLIESRAADRRDTPFDRVFASEPYTDEFVQAVRDEVTLFPLTELVVEADQSSIDSWALLRLLEAELAVTRNEVRCLVDRRSNMNALGAVVGNSTMTSHRTGTITYPSANKSTRMLQPRARLMSSDADKPAVRRDRRHPTRFKRPVRKGLKPDAPQPNRYQRTDPHADATDASGWKQQFEDIETLVAVVMNEINCPPDWFGIQKQFAREVLEMELFQRNSSRWLDRGRRPLPQPGIDQLFGPSLIEVESSNAEPMHGINHSILRGHYGHELGPLPY